MQLYQDQFSSAHDFSVTEAPRAILIIASTPRSGSHMLGHSLARTRGLGFPLEYANPTNLKHWSKLLGTRGVPRTLQAIQRRRTSPNGVFSIKLHYSHVNSLGGFSRVQRLFPQAKFVLMHRRDVARQAVSYCMATQTGVWIEGQRAVREARYDFRAIDKCLRRVLRDNARWRYALAAHGCPTMEMDYEMAKGDMRAAVLEIARFIGVEVAETIALDPPTKKQSNHVSEEWYQRFVDEYARSVNARRALAATAFAVETVAERVACLATRPVLALPEMQLLRRLTQS